MDTTRLIGLDTSIRYVAVADGPTVLSESRPGLPDASESTSDFYEELLVNPAMLLLAGRRGALDCGGLDYLIVRYGKFWQLVFPTAAGHVSVAVEASAEPLALAARIHDLVRQR